MGLKAFRSTSLLMRTPDGQVQVELTKFRNPKLVEVEPVIAPPNTPGLRQIMFVVEGLDDTVAGMRAHGAELIGEMVQYEDRYRLCYLRALRESSSRLPRNSSDAVTAVRDTGGPWALFYRCSVWQPRRFHANDRPP
jgi:hypothetical protein